MLTSTRIKGKHQEVERSMNILRNFINQESEKEFLDNNGIDRLGTQVLVAQQALFAVAPRNSLLLEYWKVSGSSGSL